MTNKKALPDDINKFFKGESVFFKKAKDEEPVTSVKVENTNKKPKVTPPHRPEATTSSNHAAMSPRHHDTVTPATLETIRKAVKQIGKEAATHRFTEDEKRAIAEIVYTYERQGYRTSENEITRIAIHWLLQDYHIHGVQSVLARLLEILHK